MELPGIHITGDYAGAYLKAIEVFKEFGHKKIAFFCGSTDISNEFWQANQKYVQLYTQAMVQQDLAEHIMVRKGTGNKEFNQAIEDLLNTSDRPTAILADIDYRGIKLIERCKELKIKVPEELSIIGFYDTPWSDHYNTSTFRFRFAEIGKAVANAVKGKENSGKIVVPIDYIEKRTVAAVK